MKKTAAVLFVAGLLVACSPKFMTPMQTDVDRMTAKFPGYTLADLQKGMSLYQSKCGACHDPKAPRSRDEAGWREIVPHMVEKSNKKGKPISPEEADLILRYVITMGKH
ncbi:MAG: hypothetical protein GC180_10715 [Bacteroidetes bacterium]|nr:hypothetical protein [Bacteroidota bacterium]